MKKKVPLEILQILAPYVKIQGELFEAVNPDGLLLKFKDVDSDSDFYFNVESYKIDNKSQLLLDFKPHNKHTIKNHRQWIYSSDLKTFFQNWLDILKEYNEVPSTFDDPIIEAFAEELYDEFEIIDDDADIKPFNLKQINVLDEYLEFIQVEINNSPIDENERSIILLETNQLKKELTSLSKKAVVKKLSKILGRLAKNGYSLIQEFMKEFKKKAFERGVKFLLDSGSEMIDNIGNQ